MTGAVLHRWDAIATVADRPGLYAWYYQPRLTERDIATLMADLAKTAETAERRALVAIFLRQHVHGPLREPPFDATLGGALKPRYAGQLAHDPTISPGLLDRLAERPERLRSLRVLFDGDPTALSSPLYIGMASKSLRNRLLAHRRLIGELRAGMQPTLTSAEIGEGDASFARAVVARAMAPSRLTVCVRPMALDAGLVDLENVLNRVFFPIFGRN